MTDKSKWLLGILLVSLAGCTALPPPPAGTTNQATGVAAPDALTQAYQHSIRAAAVRDPGFAVSLRTIAPEQPQVNVATFTEWGIPASPTQRPFWVSMPDQLRSFCHSKPDAVLAIQQTLGLPPQADPSYPEHRWLVITFSVPRSALFRPCPGGTDVGAPRCANAPASKLDAEMTHFLFEQLWRSDRVDFHTADGRPDWGYPFTGMGWTYNWDPHAASPIGVSEFVVRAGTRIGNPASTAPAQFCN